MNVSVETAQRSALPGSGLRRNLVFVLPRGSRVPLSYVTYCRGKATEGVGKSDCFLDSFLLSDRAHPPPPRGQRVVTRAHAHPAVCGVCRSRAAAEPAWRGAPPGLGQWGRQPAAVVTEEVPQLDKFLTFPNGNT